MSFWNTAQPNGFSTRCHTAFADEIYTRDPESGDFARVYPGGGSGGGGDTPYWVKPESAAIGDTNRKTTVAFDGVDIIDNVNNTACELTTTALTLGNQSGNSILTKETIDAANRVKNIAQEMDQSSKKVLLYDSTSKGITFGDQQVIPGWVQPTAAQFSSENGGISLNKDSNGNVEIQNNSNSSLIRVGGIAESGLKIIRNYPAAPIESFLDYRSIDTANKLRNIASTVSTAGQSMVTFNPTDSSFKYAPILSNPSWILPTSAEFANGSFKTTLNASSLKLDEGAVTNFLLFRNTVEPNNEVQLRWNDTIGNQISNVGAYSVLNKKLLIPGSSGVVADNTGVFCGDVGSTGNPNLSNPYVKSNNLGISLSNGPNTAAIGTTGISFTSGGVTNVITTASVASMNKLRTISSLPTPTSEYRAVLHDPTTGNYRYTPIVTPATLPVTRRIAVPDAATRYFTKVTDDFATAAGSNAPVVKLLNDGDTLLIDSVGLTSSNGLEYDTWLAIQVSSGSDAVVDCRVEVCTNTNYHAPNSGKTVVSEKYNTPHIIWHRTDTALSYSGGTIPARTLIFKLGNSNATYSTGQVFQGVISIKMIANSRTTVPA